MINIRFNDLIFKSENQTAQCSPPSEIIPKHSLADYDTSASHEKTEQIGELF